MACLIVVDIEPLLLLFELREMIYENWEKVNRDVIIKIGAIGQTKVQDVTELFRSDHIEDGNRMPKFSILTC
jgi:hypothetical protein